MALELLRGADLTGGVILGIIDDPVYRFTDSCPWCCLWRTAGESAGSGPLIILVLMVLFCVMTLCIGMYGPEQILYPIYSRDTQHNSC